METAALLSQPTKRKTKTHQTYRDPFSRIFPRLKQFACFFFKFSLPPCDIFLRSDWAVSLIYFCFTILDQNALHVC